MGVSTNWRIARPGLWVVGALVFALAVGAVIGIVFTTMTVEAQANRSFNSGSGMVLNFIKADQTSNFENVMRKVSSELKDSGDADRRRQGEGWKVYRAQEPGAGNSVLYVWFIEPAVSGADYAVSAILNECCVDEVQQIYQQFSESFAGGQQIINLSRLPGF